MTALATVYADGSSREARDTRHLERRAAEACLSQSGYCRDEIDLLISVGVYRTDFLAEPRQRRWRLVTWHQCGLLAARRAEDVRL